MRWCIATWPESATNSRPAKTHNADPSTHPIKSHNMTLSPNWPPIRCRRINFLLLIVINAVVCLTTAGAGVVFLDVCRVDEILSLSLRLGRAPFYSLSPRKFVFFFALLLQHILQCRRRFLIVIPCAGWRFIIWTSHQLLLPPNELCLLQHVVAVCSVFGIRNRSPLAVMDTWQKKTFCAIFSRFWHAWCAQKAKILINIFCLLTLTYHFRLHYIMVVKF